MKLNASPNKIINCEERPKTGAQAVSNCRREREKREKKELRRSLKGSGKAHRSMTISESIKVNSKENKQFRSPLQFKLKQHQPNKFFILPLVFCLLFFCFSSKKKKKEIEAKKKNTNARQALVWRRSKTSGQSGFGKY